MIVATTENIAGHRTVQTLGQCFGVVVRSRGLGGNIMASLRTIVGGEIHEYTRLLEEARRHALDRLVENATAMGANAILMMRYDSAEIGNTMSEIVAYGTAAVTSAALSTLHPDQIGASPANVSSIRHPARCWRSGGVQGPASVSMCGR